MTSNQPRTSDDGTKPLPFSPGRIPLRCALPVPAKRRGRVVGCAAVLLSLVLLGHSHIPAGLGLRLAIDSALPWLGLAVPVLLLIAVALRAKTAAVLVLAPAVSWFAVFGTGIAPSATAVSSPGNVLTVATQNLSAANPDPDGTVRQLAQVSPDILALEEVVTPINPAELTQWPYQVSVGTVMLLSKYPVIDAEPLTLGLGWKRALHATVDTGSETEPISIYVMHADSARLTDHANRDTMIENLAAAVADDDASRIITLGDFNASTYDSSMSGLGTLLSEPAPTAGGFGFTWPREFPLIRLDHILTRGFPNTSLQVQNTTGSDHLAVLGTLSW